MVQSARKWLVPVFSFLSAIVLTFVAGPPGTVIGRQAAAATGPQVKITDFSVVIPKNKQQANVKSIAKTQLVLKAKLTYSFSFFDSKGNSLSVMVNGQIAGSLTKTFTVAPVGNVITKNFDLASIPTVTNNGNAAPFGGVHVSYNVDSTEPPGASDVASADAGTDAGTGVGNTGNSLKVTINALTGTKSGNFENYAYNVTAVGNPNATPPFDAAYYFTITYLAADKTPLGAPAFYTFLSSSANGMWTGSVLTGNGTAFTTAQAALTVNAFDSAVPPDSGSASQ